MSHVAYVNGRYLPQELGAVSIQDRAFQFADGVYEVIWVQQGHCIDLSPHLDRLNHSLSDLSIAWPVTRAAMVRIFEEVIRRNYLQTGYLYIQVSRGVAKRDHVFPDRKAPSLIVSASRPGGGREDRMASGVRVMTIPDIRWKRCDLKTVALLANVLGKQQAKEEGYFESWQTDDNGVITEGASSNAWIVLESGEVVTHPQGPQILSGITRMGVIEVARSQGLEMIERPFTKHDALKASEAFLTSSTNFIMPVVSIDDVAIGTGRPGPVTRRLMKAYVDRIERQAAERL